MKKIILSLLVIISAGTITMAQQVYVSPNIKQTIANHKLVAILPFKTRISYKTQSRYFDYQVNKDKETDLSKITQSEIYTFLLNRSENTVDFQDIEKTDVLLRKAGIIDSLDHFSSEDIAKVLGVDAVVTGKYEIEHLNTVPQPKPAEGVASTVTPYFSGSVVTTIALKAAGNGALLWRYTNNAADYSTFTTISLVDKLMEKASKSFPYTHK